MGWPFGGYASSKKKRSEMKPPVHRQRMGYSADVPVGELKPLPVVPAGPAPGAKKMSTYDAYLAGDLKPRQELIDATLKNRDNTMKVFAVYYDGNTVGYSLGVYESRDPSEPNGLLGNIPTRILYSSILVVTADGRVLKSRFGNTTPEYDPAPYVAQPTCPAPHCELPDGHKDAHYQTLPVKPFKLSLSELSITELCLLQDAYYHTPSHDLIIAELNKRWIK